MATGDSSGEPGAGDAETSAPVPSLVDSILPLATPAVLIGGSLALFGLIGGIVAMSIGSSWTTAGTIGVGLVGIAVALDVSPAITKERT